MTQDELGKLPWDEQEFALEEDEFWQMRQMFHAIGDQTRFVIVELLYAGSTSVTDVAVTLDLSTNLASYHLRELKRAGVLKSDRDGKAKTYSLTPIAREILRTVADGIRTERASRRS